MNEKKRLPDNTWSLEQLGEFCINCRSRMADEAWLLGKAMCIAKDKCGDEGSSFTKWKKSHGFSDATASRYMRLFKAYPTENDRERLKQVGVMDALRAAGIATAHSNATTSRGNGISTPSAESPSPSAAKVAGGTVPGRSGNLKEEGSGSPAWAVELQDDDGIPLDEDHVVEMWTVGQTLAEECRKHVPWQLRLLRQKVETLLEVATEELQKAWPENEEELRQIKDDLSALHQLLPKVAETMPFDSKLAPAA